MSEISDFFKIDEEFKTLPPKTDTWSNSRQVYLSVVAGSGLKQMHSLKSCVPFDVATFIRSIRDR